MRASFDAGAKKAAVGQAQASWEQAVATYRQTVLVAFQEVEDNLAARLAPSVQSEPTAQTLPVRAPPPLEDAQGLDDYPYQLW